jgi:hypothetical protein
VAKATRFSRLTFGNAIRLARGKLKLSQEDFAERANVHRTTISSVELGKVNVGLRSPIRWPLPLVSDLGTSCAEPSDNCLEII